MNHGNLLPFSGRKSTCLKFLKISKPHLLNSQQKSISTETTIITEKCGSYQYPQWGGEVESMYQKLKSPTVSLMIHNLIG